MFKVLGLIRAWDGFGSGSSGSACFLLNGNSNSSGDNTGVLKIVLSFIFTSPRRIQFLQSSARNKESCWLHANALPTVTPGFRISERRILLQLGAPFLEIPPKP